MGTRFVNVVNDFVNPMRPILDCGVLLKLSCKLQLCLGAGRYVGRYIIYIKETSIEPCGIPAMTGRTEEITEPCWRKIKYVGLKNKIICRRQNGL